MYWVRSGTAFDLIVFSLLTLKWLIGGWLLARQVFRLRPAERLAVGAALGLVLYLALANLLAQLFPDGHNYWFASLLVLAAGISAAFLPGLHHSASLRLEELRREDLSGWPFLVAIILLTLFFSFIGRGLSIFDDYLHVPMVSRMAAGDIPPHFHLQPEVPLAYHYGLQVLAASMVRLGGFFPWSAWDISKALAIAFSGILGYLWFRRQFNLVPALLGSFLLMAGSGARYLLLFLPINLLERISSAITLEGSGADTAGKLIEALASPWLIEGGGPFPFPFAYHSGIFSSLFFALGASGALPAVIVLLLILLAPRIRQGVLAEHIAAGVVLGIILAVLALSGEHLFVPLWLGIFLAAVFTLARRFLIVKRRREQAIPKRSAWLREQQACLLLWGIALGLGAMLSAVQGGFVTQVLGGVLGLNQVSVVVQGGYNAARLVPQWPPALYSAHLGALSLFSWPQLLALLAELGPALLAIPFAAWYAWRRLQRADWLVAGLGFAVLVSLFVPLFLRYGFERSGTRLPATALWLALLLAFPLFKRLFDRSRRLLRSGLAFAYLLTVFAGLVILAVQMIVIPYTQYAYFIEEVDTVISDQYWDRLPPTAQVFDTNAARSPALFARPQRAHLDLYNPDPQWEALAEQAAAGAIARAGYDFVYIDRTWWQKMDDSQRATFRAECVLTLAQKSFSEGGFRLLLDLRNCR